MGWPWRKCKSFDLPLLLTVLWIHRNRHRHIRNVYRLCAQWIHILALSMRGQIYLFFLLFVSISVEMEELNRGKNKIKVSDSMKYVIQSRAELSRGVHYIFIIRLYVLIYVLKMLIFGAQTHQLIVETEKNGKKRSEVAMTTTTDDNKNTSVRIATYGTHQHTDTRHINDFFSSQFAFFFSFAIILLAALLLLHTSITQKDRTDRDEELS